jgi:hypothetical protein
MSNTSAIRGQTLHHRKKSVCAQIEFVGIAKQPTQAGKLVKDQAVLTGKGDLGTSFPGASSTWTLSFTGLSSLHLQHDFVDAKGGKHTGTSDLVRVL